MFVAKAKLPNGDTVRLNLPGSDFMGALASCGKSLATSKEVTPEEAKTITRLVITGEGESAKIQRRKFRPRVPKSTAGTGPITPLKGDKGGR